MKTKRPLFLAPILLAVWGLLVLPLGGCMVGPDYQAPHPEAPADWAGVAAAKAPRPTSVATEQPADVAQWWKRFHDPTLTQLVEDALKTNLSLELAVANLRQARAARGIAVAGLWPTLTGTAEYQREFTSGVTSTSKATVPAAGPTENLYMAGFDALWELDVFGGVRRNIESATANVQAAVENISNVQVTIAAEVALVALPSQPISAESPASSSAVTPSTPIRDQGSCAPTRAQPMPSSTRCLARSRTEGGTSSSVV